MRHVFLRKKVLKEKACNFVLSHVRLLMSSRFVTSCCVTPAGTPDSVSLSHWELLLLWPINYSLRQVCQCHFEITNIVAAIKAAINELLSWPTSWRLLKTKGKLFHGHLFSLPTYQILTLGQCPSASDTGMQTNSLFGECRFF